MAIHTLEQVFVWSFGSMLPGRLNGLFGPVYPRCNAEARGKTGFVHPESLVQGVFQSY